MSSFIMFLPNMVMLMGRLLKDARVPAAEKALFAAAIVYVISPLDFIPDVFPFIGQVDDLYVVALVLLRLDKSLGRIGRSPALVGRRRYCCVGRFDSEYRAQIPSKPYCPRPYIACRTRSGGQNSCAVLQTRTRPIVREIDRDETGEIDANRRMAN